MSLIDDILKFETENSFEVFYQHVHPDEKIREKSRVRELEVKEKVNEIYKKMRYADYQDNNPISEKIREKLVKLGLNLPEDKRKQCQDIEKQLEKLYIEFNKNVANSVVSLEDYTEQLEKLVKDFNIDPKHINNPSFSVIMTECSNEKVRQIAYQRFNNQALENQKVISQILELRQQLAHLNGFDNYTDFSTQFSYFDSSSDAVNFDLTPFQQQLNKDIDFLCQHFQVSSKHLQKIYNYSYYNHQYKKSISIDCKKEKYFKFSDVVEKIKVMYNMLLGYDDKESSFAEIEEEFKFLNLKIKKWDAQVFKHENGYLILDLKFRKGKFPHPSCFPIIKRHQYSKTSKNSKNPKLQKTVVCLLANINDEFLTLGELKTLFHEFGHAVHELLNLSPCGLVGGTFIKRDLVEIPSMFMEKMLATPEFLKLASVDNQLSDDMAIKIIKAAKMLNADFYLKQAILARFDLQLHRGNQVNLDKMLLCDVFTSDVKTNMLCRFVHFTGYACTYYAYIAGMICGQSLFKNRDRLFDSNKVYKKYLQSTNPDIKKLIKLDPYSLLENSVQHVKIGTESVKYSS